MEIIEPEHTALSEVEAKYVIDQEGNVLEVNIEGKIDLFFPSSFPVEDR